MESQRDRFLEIWRENKAFAVFLILMFVFRSAVADWNEVPTGSMKPTILEGDRILVNKMAYDLRVPFTHVSLYKFGDPERGDIVIFDSEASDKRLVKRVIGLPGDVVELRNNRLAINGQRLNYQESKELGNSSIQQENLFGDEYEITVAKYGSPRSNFAPVRVPENHYLVLGDNRDKSADSRVIGFVPRGEIVGRSRQVVLSFNYDNYYIPREGRFLHTL